MSLNDLAHLIEQLDGLPLLPCGAGPEGKAPIDPTTGRGLEGWESKAFTPDQILGFNGKVIAVGTRTGPAAGHLLIIDIDGRSAVEHCIAAGAYPKAAGWTIRRTTDRDRLKVAFYASEELVKLLTNANGEPIGKRVLQTAAPVYDLDADGSPKRDEHGHLIKLNKQEAIELFYGTGQCLILGAHKPSGGQYVWDGSPVNLIEPSDDWLAVIKDVLKANKVETKRLHAKGSGETQQSGPGQPCVICGRHTSAACTTYNDGERVRINCYEGQTFNPRDAHGALKEGDTVIGIDGNLYAYCGPLFNASIGGFSKFAEHVEKPKPDPKQSDTSPKETKGGGFLVLATNTLESLKQGIEDINALPTPAARTVAQYSLRNQLGLDKDAYKQSVQDLLEEQETPAPTSFEELMKLDTGKEVSIEELAAKGTLTLVAAEGHGGKTSLFYRMAEAISTGQPFAGRFKTTQGTALIYQLDESPTDAITKYRRMSLEPDNSRFLPRWKLSPSMIPELEQDMKDHSPVAVFADSLMRIFGGRGISLNDAEFGIWLYQLNNIASRYGTSFFLSHHLKKPDQQKRTRVTKHDLFGTAFLYNGTSDCWGLYPSQEDGARADEFCLEFLKARSGIQDLGTVFELQGSVEDYSWELMGIQGQTESIEERKIFADEVRDLLKLKGGHWSSEQVAGYFKQEGRSISNERARSTLVKLYEQRQGIDRTKRMNQHGTGRPTWSYYAC